MLSLLFVLGFSPTAHALLGSYLPDSELPKNVCALYGVGVREEIHSFDRSNVEVGAVVITPPEDRYLCSATIFAKNAVLTTAQCSQGVLEFIPRMTKMRDGVFHRIQLRMERSEVRCPGKDGGPEEVFTTEISGNFPHPRHGVSPERRKNDIAILKINGEFSAVPMPVALEPNSVRDLLEPSRAYAQPCRIFAYGRDNGGVIGNLRGIVAKNIYWSPEEVVYLGTDGLTDSDYGGPLVCADAQGVDHVVGVAKDLRDLDPSTRKHQSSFITTDAYANWIQFAMRTKRLDQKSALDFNILEITQAHDQLKQCIQRKSREGTPGEYLAPLKTFAGEVDTLLKTQLKSRKSGEKPDGVIRIYLDKAFEKTAYHVTICEQLARGGRNRD